jgi:hypothetical protein
MRHRTEDVVRTVGVVEPGVTRSVDRADQVSLGENLKWLIPPGKRFGEDLSGRRRAEPINGLLGDSGQPAKLPEAQSFIKNAPSVPIDNDRRSPQPMVAAKSAGARHRS